MHYDWQTIVALLIVLFAVCHVLRQTVRTFSGKKDCGSCGNCAKVPVVPADPRRIPLL